MRPRTPRLVFPAVLAGAVVLATAGAAAAHVTVDGDDTAAGSYSLLTFSASHGCDGSPSTEFAIKMPEETFQASPTRLAGWDVEKVMTDLDEPVQDAHGNEITERVDQVVYTADEPLPDGERVAFEVVVPLPEDAAGKTLYFPTVQTCEEGETAWVETPAEGQDAEELEAPAPSIVVGEASEGGHHATDATSADTERVAATTDDSSSDTLSVVAIVVGALGVILGGTALATRRRSA